MGPLSDVVGLLKVQREGSSERSNSSSATSNEALVCGSIAFGPMVCACRASTARRSARFTTRLTVARRMAQKAPMFHALLANLHGVALLLVCECLHPVVVSSLNGCRMSTCTIP